MRKHMTVKVFWGLGCGFIILLTIIILLFIKLNNEKNTAKDIAVKYLQSTYMEQMIPINVRMSLIDPAMYHVYFTPRNNMELSFEVLINLDFTLPRGNPDNYLLKFCEFHLAKDIQSIIDDLGKEDIETHIIFFHQPLYAFNVPETLEEDMSYREMESYIDYGLRFDVNKIWTGANKYAEACMILEVIDRIQASGYSPEQIVFSYQTINKEKNTSFTFSEWENISDVSQVEKLLD